MMQKFCILTWRLDAKFCIAIFPLNSLQSEQQKTDHAEIQLRNVDAKILHNHISAKFIKKSTANR